MLFLRFTPLIPNVSINVSGPIVGLPFKYFFFGTLFGNYSLYKVRANARKYYSYSYRTINSRIK
jgi:hypothetical protein